MVSVIVGALSFPSGLIKYSVAYLAKIKLKTRRFPLVVIGITGSYGKTSTKQLLRHVLKTKFRVFATGQSHNTLFSVTSDIVRYLSDEQTHAIIEYGAYKRGEIKQLAELIKPQIAIITGIAKQHYGLFKSFENLKKAKFELLESLPGDGLAFINCDDKNTKDLQSMSDQYHIPWRCFETNKWKAENFNVVNGCLNFCLQTAEEKFIIKTNLPGDIYTENIKAVLCVAEHLGIPAKMASGAIKSFEPTDHFIGRSVGMNQSTLLDDGGTSNPKGFESAIRIAESMRYLKKVLVTSGIVDLGDASDQVHEELGKAAEKVFDIIFYTGADGYDPFLKGWNKISGSKEFFRILENSDLGKLQKEVDKSTLVLIEGRLPARVIKLLKSI